jgi:hypothetical protein
MFGKLFSSEKKASLDKGFEKTSSSFFNKLGHAFLNPADNREGGIYAHIGGDQHFLKVVEYLVVDG